MYPTLLEITSVGTKPDPQCFGPLGSGSISQRYVSGSVPEIIDPVFAKTSPKRSFSMTENERFGLVFANTGSINSGTGFFYFLLKVLSGLK